jgi:alpha-amylase
MRQISGDGENFGLPFGSTYTLAFSRLLYAQEVLVAYNVSDQARADCVIVDATLHANGTTMKFLYGGVGTVPVQTAGNGSRFVKLALAPHQFAILR